MGSCPHLKRNKYGLIEYHMKVLRFLCKQDNYRAFSNDIGKEIVPGKPVKIYGALYSLARRKLIQLVGTIRGYYELTTKGQQIVEELADE